MIDYRAKWAAVMEWCRAHPSAVTHGIAFILGVIAGRLV